MNNDSFPGGFDGKKQETAGSSSNCDGNVTIMGRLKVIREKSIETREILKLIKEAHDEFLTLEKKNPIEIELTQKRITLKQLLCEFEIKSAKNLGELRDIQENVQDEELKKWKEAEKLARYNGHLDKSILEHLQEYFEELAEIIWTHREQLKDAEQIISRFMGPVPEESLNFNSIQYLQEWVTVRIINEGQKIQLMTAEVNQENLDSVGDIINNCALFSYNEDTRILACDFKAMKLNQNVPKIRSLSSARDIYQFEEKFCLCFHCQFKIHDFEVKIWTLSLPVLILNNHNQAPRALANIIYDDAFGPLDRIGFKTPDTVPWKDMADVLNIKFKSICGQGLTEENIDFLAEKIFKTKTGGVVQETASWSQFAKENLPGRDYTFWDWFNWFMKLISEHLKSLWIDRSIIGFISEEQAGELLRGTKLAGNFLLKASESKLGAIEIFCIDNANNILKVFFSAKDLMVHGLPDIINDLENLIYLYPNIPKSEAFSKYYTTDFNMQGPQHQQQQKEPSQFNVDINKDN